MIIKNLKWLQPTDNRDSSNYFLAKTSKRPSFDSEAIFSSLSLSLSLFYIFSSSSFNLSLQLTTVANKLSPLPTPIPTPNRRYPHRYPLQIATLRIPLIRRRFDFRPPFAFLTVAKTQPHHRDGSLASDHDGYFFFFSF